MIMVLKNFLLLVLFLGLFSEKCSANIATDDEAILFNVDDLNSAHYVDFMLQIKQLDSSDNFIGMYEDVFSDIQKDTLSYDSAIVMCHVSLKETPVVEDVTIHEYCDHAISLPHVYDEAELSRFAEASNLALHNR